jgi:hypothetical protein
MADHHSALISLKVCPLRIEQQHACQSAYGYCAPYTRSGDHHLDRLKGWLLTYSRKGEPSFYLLQKKRNRPHEVGAPGVLIAPNTDGLDIPKSGRLTMTSRFVKADGFLLWCCLYVMAYLARPLSHSDAASPSYLGCGKVSLSSSSLPWHNYHHHGHHYIAQR